MSYGLMLAYPIREALCKLSSVRGGWADAYAVTAVLATGAFYELTEMWGAVASMAAIALLRRLKLWKAQLSESQ